MPLGYIAEGLFFLLQFIHKEQMGESFMWIKYNNNPAGRAVGDCAVRAVAKALGIDWEQAFLLITSAAYQMGDMPSSNSVWGAVLRQHGFYRAAIENECPDCYTAKDFARDNPEGVFVLGFGNHVVTVIDGDIYDSWDSSNEVPQYFWYRKDEMKNAV